MPEPVSRSECRDIHRGLNDDVREDINQLHTKMDKIKQCIDIKFHKIASWIIMLLIAVIASMIAVVIK